MTPRGGRMKEEIKKVSRMIIVGFILILSGIVSGCATVHQLPIENAIYIDHDGSPVASKKHEFTDEKDFEEHLKKIGDGIRASKKKKILIFVHGGLNSLDEGIKKADSINAIAADKDQPYPIFVNWDSDFSSTYWEHLTAIRQGKVEPPMYGWPTIPAIILEDTGRMVTRLPISWWRQLETDFKGITFPTQPFSSACPDQYEHYMHPEAQAVNALTCTLTEDYKKGKPKTVNIALGKGDVDWLTWASAGRTAHYVVTFPFKYATVPLLDGFAAPAWDNMIRRTKTMYRRPQEFDIRKAVQKNYKNSEEVKQIARHATEFKETGALARLLHGLNDMAAGGTGQEKNVGIPMQTQTTPQSSGEYEITVIGHSMGTIVLNEFIRDYDTYPNLKITNIVYMAAACSIRDFERSIIPYLRSDRGKDAKFYNLTLHPWNDARETNGLGFVPRGSLLEWIDNFLTTPITPMDRTLGKWENIVQATHIIPDDVRDRVFIKGFPVGDTLTVGPQMHGEFDDYNPKENQKWKFWEKAFWETTKDN